MATRTHARESIVGVLYAYDMGNESILNHIDTVLEDKKIRNKQKDFAIELLDGTIKNIDNIDQLIISHLKQRDILEVGKVEKAILRLSIYEMKYTNTDKAIIINEAIELSKKLASDNAPRFINGLLDKIDKK